MPIHLTPKLFKCFSPVFLNPPRDESAADAAAAADDDDRNISGSRSNAVPTAAPAHATYTKYYAPV